MPADFDIDVFLAQPLTTRVATNGPTVRPAWYLWEDQAFWILTGPWARLLERVQADPALAVTVDVCDIGTGLVRQVIAGGRAEMLPFDVPRGRRKLSHTSGRTKPAGTAGSATTCTTTRASAGRCGSGCVRRFSPPPTSATTSEHGHR